MTNHYWYLEMLKVFFIIFQTNFKNYQGNIKVIDIRKQTVRNNLKIPQNQKNIKLIFTSNNLIAAGENIIKLYDTNGILK